MEILTPVLYEMCIWSCMDWQSLLLTLMMSTMKLEWGRNFVTVPGLATYGTSKYERISQQDCTILTNILCCQCAIQFLTLTIHHTHIHTIIHA